MCLAKVIQTLLWEEIVARGLVERGGSKYFWPVKERHYWGSNYWTDCFFKKNLKIIWQIFVFVSNFPVRPQVPSEAHPADRPAEGWRQAPQAAKGRQRVVAGDQVTEKIKIKNRPGVVDALFFFKLSTSQFTLLEKYFINPTHSRIFKYALWENLCWSHSVFLKNSSRFQGDERPYPRHPPLVCFYTGLSKFPRPALLNITKRLMEEAKAHARDEAPCVFALTSLLENR